MRGERLALLAVAVWLALAAFIVLQVAVLPEMRIWAGPTPAPKGAGVVPVLPRPAPVGPRVTAAKRSSGDTVRRLPRSFPRCWARGLRDAASAGRSHWSPAEPACFRRWAGPVRKNMMWPRCLPGETRPGPGAADPGRATVDAWELRGAVLEVFEEIRGANYRQFLAGGPGNGGTDPRAGPRRDNARYRPRGGMTSPHTFTGCPIASIEVGDVFLDDRERPTVPYRLTLTDGSVLAGDLVFEYVDLGRGGCWYPVTGLDWLIEGSAP